MHKSTILYNPNMSVGPTNRSFWCSDMIPTLFREIIVNPFSYFLCEVSFPNSDK